MSAYFETSADRYRALGPLNLQVENGEICTIIGPPGFDKKEGLQKLAPKENFDCKYLMIFEDK